MTSVCSFNLSHYRDLLRTGRQEGYSFTKFSEAREDGRSIIVLRHDVDRNFRKALDMAKVEREEGVSATYFIRVHGDYNPFSFDVFSGIRELENLGHEIGLHFEAADFSSCFDCDEVEAFRREKRVLDAIVDRDVTCACEHGIPGKNWGQHFFTRHSSSEVGILRHPFDEVFGKMKYISDSTGRWREGCLCQFLGKQHRIQVLTHPNHWFHKHYSL